MAEASPDEIATATLFGVKTPLSNGDVLHTHRHPSSPDHQITVVTRNKRVMSSNVVYKPFKEVEAQRKKAIGEAKAKADRTKAAKASRLAKKRARSAAASMKKGNKTKN